MMVDFIERVLQRTDGGDISFITHMEIGPDNLLYASTFDGRIQAFGVKESPDGAFFATLVHEITVLTDVQNHDDDGTPVDLPGRLVIGFDVVGTPDNPVIYVNSSDPRINVRVDSNSGILHRISMNADGEWERLDLVRGLPRSQHDHAPNGVEYVVGSDGKTFLLLNIGGLTNAGAPSSPLEFLAEYALSGAVLKVDLDALAALPTLTDVYGARYLYNLPTLDDPTRPGVNEGVDSSIEVFGGAGGLNQAKLTADGPVTIFAAGVRNTAETIETSTGALLTFDNGGNPSWGNAPTIVDSVATNLPSTGTQTTSNLDQLHLLVEGAYLGHPNPTRASGSAAGLYQQDSSGTPLPDLPADYADVVYATDPRQGYFLREGVEDGAVALSSKSTNGLAEYTFRGAFDGEAAGDIFAMRYGPGTMIRIKLTDADGDGLPESGVTVEEFDIGVSGVLDVLAPRVGQILYGGLLVSGLSETGAIHVLVPGDGGAQGADDRDGDGLRDVLDPFAYDPANGRATMLAAGETLFWDFESTTRPSDLPGGVRGFSVGVSGFMIDGVSTPEELSLNWFEPAILGGDDVVLGGTANTILIGSTPGGTAVGPDDTQRHGFQAGFTPQSDLFTLTAEVWSPFRTIAPENRTEAQKSGVYLGDGTQLSFVALYVGDGYVELIYEEGGVLAASQRIEDARLRAVDLDTYAADLSFDVDARTGVVTGRFRADTTLGEATGGFAPVQTYGAALAAIQGRRAVSGVETAAAWGLIATSGGDPFEANFGSVALAGADAPPTAGAALINVDAASSDAPGAFRVTNVGPVEIRSITITLADTLVPDLFFEAAGAVGVAAAPFTVGDGGLETGTTDADGVVSNPLPGGGNATLTITPEDFDPGETLAFSIGVAPQGAAGFDPTAPQGDISGLEMTGALACVTFADGGVAVGTLFGDGPASASALLGGDPAPAIRLTLGGVSNGGSGVVTDPAQTLLIEGRAGETVAVMIGAGDALPDDASGRDLLNAVGVNAIEGVFRTTVALDIDGRAALPITLADPAFDDPDGGVRRIVAIALDAQGRPAGFVGAPLSIVYDDTPPPPEPVLVAAINVGGGAFDSVDDNIAFAADPGVAEGAPKLRDGGDVAVAGTQDDRLYATYAIGNCGYEIPVAVAGDYAVTLYLAEPFFNSPDQRAFQVALEGVASGVFAEVRPWEDSGGLWRALKVAQTVTVDDGVLDIDLTGLVRDALISAFTVHLVNPAPDNPPPTTEMVAAVNVGGAAFAATNGTLFAADPGPASGSAILRDAGSVAVAGTGDDGLYASYRFGTAFGYDVAVGEAGLYRVTLLLAEPFFQAAGARAFDVALEGAVGGDFADIRPWEDGGGRWSAFSVSRTVAVNDGVLDIDVAASVNNGLLNGFIVQMIEPV
jgi:hypothetical protein